MAHPVVLQPAVGRDWGIERRLNRVDVRFVHLEVRPPGREGTAASTRLIHQRLRRALEPVQLRYELGVRQDVEGGSRKGRGARHTRRRSEALVRDLPVSRGTVDDGREPYSQATIAACESCPLTSRTRPHASSPIRGEVDHLRPAVLSRARTLRRPECRRAPFRATPRERGRPRASIVTNDLRPRSMSTSR